MQYYIKKQKDSEKKQTGLQLNYFRNST
jgi:hypothetical protein